MSKYTENYNLIMPDETDNYDIKEVTSKNMSIIDAELKKKLEANHINPYIDNIIKVTEKATEAADKANASSEEADKAISEIKEEYGTLTEKLDESIENYEDIKETFEKVKDLSDQVDINTKSQKVHLTAGAANSYIINDPNLQLKEGMHIFIKFHTANTSTTVNVNINELGNMRIYRYGTTGPVRAQLSANSIWEFVFKDGALCMVGGLASASSTNYGLTRVIDALNNTGTTDALSANQGKILKEQADDLQRQINESEAISPSTTHKGTNIIANTVERYGKNKEIVWEC